MLYLIPWPGPQATLVTFTKEEPPLIAMQSSPVYGKLSQVKVRRYVCNQIM